MYIILMMLLLGFLLGFVGAGGAGCVIALLTLIFDVLIHSTRDIFSCYGIYDLESLHYLTAGMLFLSAVFMMINCLS